jgi:hypothetical protein
MPCYEPGPNGQDEREHRSGLTAGLCVACETLEALGALPGSLRAWYIAHRNADQARDQLTAALQELEAKAAPLRASKRPLPMTDPLWERANQATRAQDRAAEIERAQSVKLATQRSEVGTAQSSAEFDAGGSPSRR